MLPSNSTIILCSTARFARSLQQAHTQLQINNNYQEWQPLNVKTLEAWLDEVLNISLLTGEIDVSYAPQKRLSLLEERLVWQQVIASTLKQQALGDLFDLAGLADACIEANRYVVAWHLRIAAEVDHKHYAEETRQFLAWQQLFQQRCKSLNALENVRYCDWQIDSIAKGAAHLPQSIAFAGFDQNAPQEQRLREVLTGRGCILSDLQTGRGAAGQAQHVVLPDQTHEMRSMVAWAKAMHDADSSIKLALVVPNLSALRNQLADLVDDVFQPASIRPSLAETARIYNFSLGDPLANQPVIQAALHLIRLFASRQLNQTDITSAWLSPYWSASEREADHRALLDAAMREHLPQSTDWSRVMRFMQQQATHFNLSQLIEDSQAALMHMQGQARKQWPSDWANAFKQLLQKLKWSGERSESSHEYQAKQAWEKALQQLSQLNFLGDTITANAANALLQQICKEQVFQPETLGVPAIQILGMMEALSAPVDAMWVMGMNDDTWPLPARPNPLLPASIQRAARVANADSAVQTEFAQVIHQRLLNSAQTIIFSSSLKQADKVLRASPLMQDIALGLETFSIANTLAERIAAEGNADMRLMDDYIAPAVVDGEHVRGGTGLFRAQAICPAWAFYQFRLGAKSLKTPKNGLDAAERGQLVHSALEAFWSNAGQYRHSNDLQAFSAENMHIAITESVTTAIKHFTQNNDEALSPTILMLEHERLSKLLENWLQFEKSRGITFNMVACEIEKKVTIGGIEVTLKIDRIHQLEDGGLELVDYKTGQLPKIKSWGDTRITEPQLPIYAVFYAAPDEYVAGIQFGLVKITEHGFSGISETNFDDEREKRKPDFIRKFNDWQALKAHWKMSIEAIAQEIKAGEAAIYFENESDFKYCEVSPLLRLPERQLQFERQLQISESND